MHHPRTKAPEDLEQALAGRDGNDTDGRRLLSIRVTCAAVCATCDEGVVLELHVLDLDLGQRAVVDREFERLSGSQGVDVDAQQVGVAHGDDRLAQPLHTNLDLIHRQVTAA